MRAGCTSLGDHKDDFPYDADSYGELGLDDIHDGASEERSLRAKLSAYAYDLGVQNRLDHVVQDA
jgi:hypothetical protein